MRIVCTEVSSIFSLQEYPGVCVSGDGGECSFGSCGQRSKERCIADIQVEPNVERVYRRGAVQMGRGCIDGEGLYRWGGAVQMGRGCTDGEELYRWEGFTDEGGAIEMGGWYRLTILVLFIV